MAKKYLIMLLFALLIFPEPAEATSFIQDENPDIGSPYVAQDLPIEDLEQQGNVQESTQNESSKYEPTQNESTQDEPTQDEPTQDEPTQNESTQNESTDDEITEDESTKNESTQDEPTQNESIQDELIQNELNRNSGTDSPHAVQQKESLSVQSLNEEPSYLIIIPDTWDNTSSLAVSWKSFLDTDSLWLSVESKNGFMLKCNGESIPYDLLIGGQTYDSKFCLTDSDSGNRELPLQIRHGSAPYAGVYTDTLTFSTEFVR